jgi:phosphoribosyl 1,2-cyclic phosphate phosphodiesterase
MQITFLGTGTSAGVPVIGCTCAVCCSTDERNKRLRTAALLHARGKNILIDVGPDFRTQALRHPIRHLDAVVITHSHFDHIGGLDDLRPITDHHGPIPIYGSPKTLDSIRQRFSYAFSTDSEGSSRPQLELCPVNGSFQAAGVPMTPFDVMHGTWTITGYRVGRLGYVTDASALPPATRNLLGDLDVLVLNALRYKPHPTHFTLDEALDVIADLRPRRAFLVHTTHAFDYTATNATLPDGVALAYDGLTVTVAE